MPFVSCLSGENSKGNAHCSQGQIYKLSGVSAVNAKDDGNKICFEGSVINAVCVTVGLTGVEIFDGGQIFRRWCKRIVVVEQVVVIRDSWISQQ